jgi:hypothetical protein
MIRPPSMRTWPFALLVIASCGSSSSGSSSGSSGTNSSGSGEEPDGTTGLGDGQASSGEGSEGDGANGSSGTGTGSGTSESGSSSGSASGSSSGSGSGSTTEGGSTTDESVYQMHNHVNRDGLYVDGTLTKASLMTAKTLKIDASFAGTIAGNAYASPLYVADGVGHKGTFYVATESNNVYALDETTGASAIPSKSAGPAAGSTGCALSNISPLGITGTPAIDPTTRLIVFDAATAATEGGPLSKHTIHAWSIDDFSEKWSLDVSTLTDPGPAGKFTASDQNQRGAVLIVGGVAYVTYGGHYGDCTTPEYYGWIVGVPLAGGPTQAKEYATPSTRAGMWAPGGPSSDGTSIFASTGNGTDTGTWMGENSVLKFGPGPTFTSGASNYLHAVKDDQGLGNDEDLGAAGPLMIHDPAITPSNLIVQLGKDGDAWVINSATMGGEASPVATTEVMNDQIINVPAWATAGGSTYVAMVSEMGGGGVGCKTGSGNLAVMTLSATAQITVPWCANNQGGGSPSITSSDGTKDMLVWTVGTGIGPQNSGGSGQIHAWDLQTGAPVITGSDMISNTTRHFTVPIFVHGRAIVVADNRLYALKP